MDQLQALRVRTAIPQDSSCWWRTKSNNPPTNSTLQTSHSHTNSTLQMSQSHTNSTLQMSQSPTNSTLQMSQSPTNSTLQCHNPLPTVPCRRHSVRLMGLCRDSRLHSYQKTTSRGASSNVRTAGARVFVQKGCYLRVTRVDFYMPSLLKIKPELQLILNPPVYKWNNTHFWNANKLITYGLNAPT